MKSKVIVRYYLIPFLLALLFGYSCYRWNAFRYFMATLMIALAPSAFLFWFLIHPFISFWRKAGVRWTYVCVSLLCLGAAFGLYIISDRLLDYDLGMNLPLVCAGVLIITLAQSFGMRWREQLSLKTLVGLPELDPTGRPESLLTDGIYAVIRHPRYVEVSTGLVGWALLVNFPAVYGLVVVTWIALYIVVIIEEKELRDRWGEEYQEYCARVPRFIPNNWLKHQ